MYYQNLRGFSSEKEGLKSLKNSDRISRPPCLSSQHGIMYHEHPSCLLPLLCYSLRHQNSQVTHQCQTLIIKRMDTIPSDSSTHLPLTFRAFLSDFWDILSITRLILLIYIYMNVSFIFLLWLKPGWTLRTLFPIPLTLPNFDHFHSCIPLTIWPWEA